MAIYIKKSIIVQVSDIETYDFIIIGTGSAGYPAAVYAARFGLKTLVIGGEKGGLITTTHVVENYPGFVRVTGQELADSLENHVKDYNVPIIVDWVTEVKKETDHFIVTAKENTYKAKTVLIATGTKHRKLDVPGEPEYYGKGVSYCAICDGPLFKGKTVAVVGGSDSAAKEALLLTEHASKVYMIYRGQEIRPEPINKERVFDLVKAGNIEIINKTNVVEIKGGKFISSVVLDNPYKGSTEFPLGGLFIDIGHLPQSDLAKSLGVNLNEKGEIIIDKESKTNVPGIFAAGDVTNTKFKQAITGAAEGCTAAYSAYNYISEQNTKKGKEPLSKIKYENGN